MGTRPEEVFACSERAAGAELRTFLQLGRGEKRKSHRVRHKVGMELIWSLVHLLFIYLIREAASIHFTFPDAALPQLPIAMLITNPRQIPLAACLQRCMGSSASIATRNRCDSFQSSTQSDLD
jgi:hypothetical protein